MNSLYRRTFTKDFAKSGQIKNINIGDEYAIINYVTVHYVEIKSICNIKEAGFFKNRFEFEFTMLMTDGSSKVYRVYEGLYKFKKANTSGYLIVNTLKKALKEYQNNPHLIETKKRMESYDGNHPFFDKFKQKFGVPFIGFMHSFICLGKVAMDKPLTLEERNYITRTLYYNDKYFWFDCSGLIDIAKDAQFYLFNKPDMKFLSTLDALDRGFDNQWHNIYELSLIKYIEEYKTDNFIYNKPLTDFKLGMIEEFYGTAAAVREASKPLVEKHQLTSYRIVFDKNYFGPEVYFTGGSVRNDLKLHDFVKMFDEESYKARINKTEKKKVTKETTKKTERKVKSDSTADEIRKYKKLLDDGIITEE